MKKTGKFFIMVMVLVMVLTGCSSGTNSEAAPAETQEPAKAELPSVAAPEIASVEIVEQMPEKELNFAFLCFQNNPFWELVRNGSDIGAEYLKNYNVNVDYVVLGDVLDAQTINAGIDAAIVQQYDGIVVTPFSPGTEVYIDKAVDAGIPVVTLFGESPIPSKRTAFLGQEAYAAGQFAGKYVADEVGAPGKFAIITGLFNVEVHEQRRKGFEDYLIDQGWENVGTYEGKDKADLTYNYAKDIMTAHPDVAAIYMTAGGPFGAARATVEMDKVDDVIVLGYDEVPDNLDYVEKGEMIAISQDVSGVALNGLITLYNKVVADVEPEPDFLPSKTEIITAENASKFR